MSGPCVAGRADLQLQSAAVSCTQLSTRCTASDQRHALLSMRQDAAGKHNIVHIRLADLVIHNPVPHGWSKAQKLQHRNVALTEQCVLKGGKRRAQCEYTAHVGCDVGDVEAAHEAEGDQEAPAKVLHRVAETLPVQQHVVDLQGGHDGGLGMAPVRSMQAALSMSAGRQLTAQTAKTTTRTTADGRSSCQLVAGAAGRGFEQ